MIQQIKSHNEIIKQISLFKYSVCSLEHIMHTFY